MQPWNDRRWRHERTPNRPSTLAARVLWPRRSPLIRCDGIEAAEPLDVAVDDVAERSRDGSVVLAAALEAREQAEAASFEDTRDGGLEMRARRRWLLGAALAAQSSAASAVASEVWLGDERGFEDRSRKPTSLRSERATTWRLSWCGVELARCGSLTQPWSTTARPLLSTWRQAALSWRRFGSRCEVGVSQLQLPRSGPNGQPPESSHLLVGRLFRSALPSTAPSHGLPPGVPRNSAPSRWPRFSLARCRASSARCA